MGQVGGRQQLDEIYFVQKVKLGQGSFGCVWRAKHRQSGDTVAVKQMDKATMPKRGVTRHDIEREVKMMKACNHVNITKLFDTFEDSGSIYLALEYCDGGDFGDKVKELGPVITEKDTAEWMRQMCEALSHLHAKGICHRDIKPDNFMVAGDSELKLADFGLAIYVRPGDVLTDKCGTPAFMAPEQHRMPVHSRGYGFPCDMWAAGVSMYMIIFGGKHPFLNKRNELDQRLMIEGRMDFTDTSSVAAQGLGLFGLGETIQKFSETARNFCKRLVCVNQSSRLTASNALREPWLNSGRRSAESNRKPMENGTPTAGTPRNGTPRNGTPRNGTPRKGGGTPRNGEAGANATAVPKGGMPPRPGFGYPQAEVDEKAKELEKLQKRVNELEAREREQEQKKTEEDDKARNKAKSFRTQKTKVTEVGTPGTPMSDLSPTTLMPAPRLLVPGTKCRYEPSSSSKFSFIPAMVQSFNDLDSTYNLDCRPHADPYRISPAKDISCEQAWPRGTLVHYKSEQREKQGGVQPPLPAVVKSFNESDQTYNLDIRDHADCDRIRIRVITREGGPSSEPGITSAIPRHAQVEKRVTRHFNGTEAAKLNEDAIRTESDAAAPETPAETKRIGEGFWCHVPEHDLRARVLSVRGGVAELEIGGASTEKKLELLRAPKDNKEMAWPKGTQVMYHSVTGGGRWIEAHIEQFNPHNGTYNLDVRPEADADKVRPR